MEWLEYHVGIMKIFDFEAIFMFQNMPFQGGFSGNFVNYINYILF
jgi:hypothetical protein